MRKITVEKNNAGQRLDRFLKAGIFFDATETRGEVIRMIKAGRIAVNGKAAKPSYPLKAGDEIMLDIKDTSKIELAANGTRKIPIIYQDENIIVFDKPAGVRVHPDHFEKKETLVNYILADRPEIKDVHDGSAAAQWRPGIVHRLDRDTSGVIVVARNQSAYAELQQMFRDRKIHKTYQAIVWGVPDPSSGTIDKPLARSADYRKQVIAGRKTKTKIREAVTEYRLLEKVGADYALLELKPRTGRMHQLRVHLASIGHPIVGDQKYHLKDKRRQAGAERQLLHARELEFDLFGKPFRFQSELPGDFVAFLDENRERG